MWTHYHVSAFLLTFCTYVILHASRKVYSDSKDALSQEWTPEICNSSWPCLDPYITWRSMQLFPTYKSAEPFLGLLDSLFLFAYAIGMYFTSMLADRYELRKGLSIGMWLAGILLFIFGFLTQILGFYNKGFYISMWILQGIVQSIGWPTCIAVIGNWFGKSGRGLLLGIWGSCASIGNIVGNFVTAALLFYGYEYAFLTLSAVLVGGGTIIFFGLVNSPIEVGLHEPVEFAPVSHLDDDMNEATNATSEKSLTTSEEDLLSANKNKPLSFLEALLLPGVISYSLSFACYKFVNYAFFFWLPYYLTNHFKWSSSLSSKISTWYDVGGIVGGIVTGAISDRLKTRSPVLVFMMVVSPFALWGYKSSPNNVVINSVLMAFVGFFINGASTVLSTSLPVDLAKQEAVGRNRNVLATVTGIIDGTGSLGSAIGQYLVAVIQTQYGWSWVFNFFIIANVFAIIFLIPIFYKDIKKYTCWDKLFHFSRKYSVLDDENGTG